MAIEEANALQLDRIATIYDNLKLVFQIAREEDLNTREASARLAEMRLEKARAGRASRATALRDDSVLPQEVDQVLLRAPRSP